MLRPRKPSDQQSVPAEYPRSIQRLMAFIRPIRCVLSAFAPMHAKPLALVGGLGLAASALQAAGYLALVPLIGFAVNGQETLELGSWSVPATDTSLMLLVGAVVMLSVVALEVDYLGHRMALSLVGSTLPEAALRGLSAVAETVPAARRRRAVNDVMGGVAFACGMLIRQIAAGLSDLFQGLAFLIVLLWMSYALTATFVVVALAVGFFYVRSLMSVTGAVKHSRELALRAREETNAVAAMLDDEAISHNIGWSAVRDRVREAYDSGILAQVTERRLHIRRQMRRGPMLLQYLFPLALVLFLLSALPKADLNEMLGPIIVYLLILRQLIALMQSLASRLMFVGRLHPQLQCFADLQSRASTPRCPFAGTDRAAGEEDESDAF